MKRRKRYYIDRKLQGRFALLFLLAGLLVAVGAAGAIWYLSSNELERYIFRSHVRIGGPWDLLFPIVLKSLLVAIGGLLLFAAAAVRTAFRRIGSELLSVNRAMSRIGEGDLSTPVPECRIAECGDALESARKSLLRRVGALSDLHRKMAVVAADPVLSDEAASREIAALCAAFSDTVPSVGTETDR